MTDLKQIEKLNKNIEILMKKRVEAKAKKEMCLEEFNKGVQEYIDRYGVNLKGGTPQETKDNFIKEARIVDKDISEKTALAEKLISLINNGEINEAWKVLGVNKNEAEVGVINLDEIKTAQPKKEQVVEEDFDDEDFIIPTKKEELIGVTDGMDFDDDLEDEDIIAAQMPKKKSIPVEDDFDDYEDDEFEELEESSLKMKNDAGSFFGGFTDILKDTPHERS